MLVLFVYLIPGILTKCGLYLMFLLQVILASLEQGVREGRMLLHDWLVILTAQYNDTYKIIQYNSGNKILSQIDVAFSQCPQLQHLTRLVFALLRSPLLRSHEEGVHPDDRIYLQCLFRYLVCKLFQFSWFYMELRYNVVFCFYLLFE